MFVGVDEVLRVGVGVVVVVVVVVVDVVVVVVVVVAIFFFKLLSHFSLLLLWLRSFLL